MKQIIFRSFGLVFTALFLFGCGGTENSNSSVTSFSQLLGFAGASSVDYLSEPGVQVGIEISKSDSEFDHYLVTLEGDHPTAWDALQATGLETFTMDFGWGVAICAIDGVGRMDEICFNDLGENYWGFYRLDSSNGEWISAEVGASDYMVSDGEVLSFVWGQ